MQLTIGLGIIDEDNCYPSPSVAIYAHVDGESIDFWLLLGLFFQFMLLPIKFFFKSDGYVLTKMRTILRIFLRLYWY